VATLFAYFKYLDRMSIFWKSIMFRQLYRRLKTCCFNAYVRADGILFNCRCSLVYKYSNRYVYQCVTKNTGFLIIYCVMHRRQQRHFRQFRFSMWFTLLVISTNYLYTKHNYTCFMVITGLRFSCKRKKTVNSNYRDNCWSDHLKFCTIRKVSWDMNFNNHTI